MIRSNSAAHADRASRWAQRILFVLVLALSQTACATLPSAQLSSYLSVSEEARTAGNAIYGALNKAVEFNKSASQAGRSGACSPDADRPTCFDPSQFLPSPPITDPDIRARILALETVAAYNDTLVALASGQGGAQLDRKITAYGAVAGRFAEVAGVAKGGIMPLLAEPTLTSIGTIGGLLENARTQIAVRQSLSEQQPVITALTTALIEDTPAVFQLYQTAQLNFARSRPGGPGGAEGQREFLKIKAMHDSLGAYVILLSNKASSFDALLAASAAQVTDPEALDAALSQAIEVKAAAEVLENSIRRLVD